MPNYIQGRIHFWNHFDELGLIVGVKRLQGETNRAFKSRILARYENTQNSAHQGLVNAITSDLGYETYNVIDKTIFLLTNRPLITEQVTVTIDGDILPEVIESFPLPSGWFLPVGVDLVEDPSGIAPMVPSTIDDADASGFILWRDNNGDYTNILELLQPSTNMKEMVVEYYYEKDGYIRYYKEETFSSRLVEDIDLYGLEGRFTTRKEETDTGITVNALSDSDFRTNTSNGLITSEGTATALLESIAEEINRAAPVLWDYFRWDEGRWDAGDKEETGSEALPIILDATPSGFNSIGGS